MILVDSKGNREQRKLRRYGKEMGDKLRRGLLVFDAPAGIMGMLGLPLNIGTCMVAAIAIGISVDDTIHFMTRYNAEMRRLQDKRRAIESVLHFEALPFISTSLSLMLGFSSVFGIFEIHAEALWNYTYDLKDDHYLRYVWGAKLTYDIVLEEEDIQIKIEPTLEYAGEWLIERQSHPDYSNSTQGRRYFMSSLLGSFLFRINEISFYLNAQYEFDKAGFLFGAWSEFELEMFKFNIGLQYFPDSPSTSSYFNWRHNDRIVGSITYSF